MTQYIILFFIGILSGFFSGTFGVGGGFIVVPLLYSLTGLPPEAVVSISALQMIGTSFAGTVTHIAKKNVVFREALFITLPALASSYFGVKGINSMGGGFGERFSQLTVGDIFLTVTLSVLFFSIGIYSLIQGKKTSGSDGGEPDVPVVKNPVCFIAIGLIVGFCPSMLGVGGGFLIVPFLMYFAGFMPVKATATSLFQIFFVSVFVSFMNFRAGEFYPFSAIAILSGSMPAASFFAHRSARYNPRKVKIGFGILCFLALLVTIAGFTRRLF
ncbi:MAG: sulfite exporter TauE/SafE family protein [bacterium]|nr:sulfite exporter TauE/SafE family protein [bacterium]